jgi:hypothetical protein
MNFLKFEKAGANPLKGQHITTIGQGYFAKGLNLKNLRGFKVLRL